MTEAKVTADYPHEDRVKAAVESSKANWVERLRSKDLKTIPTWDEPGKVSSHRMSWAEEDGRYYVYPNVQEINGKLHDFTDKKYKHGEWDAFRSALSNGDYVEFDNEADARYLAEDHYKKYFNSTKEAYKESQDAKEDNPWML